MARVFFPTRRSKVRRPLSKRVDLLIEFFQLEFKVF